MFFFSQRSMAVNASFPYQPKVVSVDSVLDKLMLYAPFYEKIIGEYKADLYLKRKVYTKKKNLLLRFVPSMGKTEKYVRKYLMESYSELHFTAPNIYDQKLKACFGTNKKPEDISGDVFDYFHIHIYSATLLHKKLLSPLAPNGRKYYSYKIDSVLVNSRGEVSYRIEFAPKNPSYQLVHGYMILSNNVWSVREIYFAGRSEYRFFDNLIKMGDVGADNEFLPVRYDVNTTFRFLGNVVESNYTALLNYQSIQYQQVQHKYRRVKKVYDLSGSYTLQCDTNSFNADSLPLNKIRPIKLSDEEAQLYKEAESRNDTMIHHLPFETKRWAMFGETGDALTSNYSINLFRMGAVKCSPLINPFLLSYNGTDGVSYRQAFKYNRLLVGDRLLSVVPKVGYNFKQKEVYWSVNSDFDYWPRKRAAIHLSFGNGNRIYSSDVLDELKNIPDSAFDFNKIQLAYFRDLYLNFNHSLEITNGLTLSLGISTHKRSAIKNSNLAPIDSLAPEAKVKNVYVSFAPRVRLDWTPGQYYYMNGDRKINLHSDYPTFSVDWERGLKGVFNSSGQYERLELDIQHQRSIGLMRSVYWRFGCGTFTNQKQTYFVDFTNFTKSNLPVGWNDDIGGVFQLLDRRWYNSSSRYVRGHFTYESPFLILPRVVKYSRNILNERLYASFLVVPHIRPYLEFGYGIGTHIFDLGVFLSSVNGSFSEVGCKFTFELFNR
nr:DUF5686 family protein [Bacteroides ihuae]